MDRKMEQINKEDINFNKMMTINEQVRTCSHNTSYSHYTSYPLEKVTQFTYLGSRMSPELVGQSSCLL
jgi:hypothetical protein